MAIVKRRTLIANPARRKKRNGPRKKMSAKQIKHFGTARQKAALKASRTRKRKASAPKAHRKRTVKSNPRRAARRAVRKSSHRKRTARRAVRKNVGEVVSLMLGNPARKRGKKMATKAKRRKNTSPRRTRRVARRKNGTVARRRHTRRNFGGAVGGDVVEVLYMIGGGVGSKLLTQMVLSTSNTGVMGYAGNLAAGALLAWATKAVLKNPSAAKNVFKGAILQVVLRAITDYTPFGSYTSQLGMGDYMASNWVSPQRYVDALNSAQVQIPNGWGPTAVMASSGVDASAMGAGNGDGSGIY